MTRRLHAAATAAAAAAACLLAAPARAGGGDELLKNQCSACHALAKPADAGTARLLARKGPDLHLAGLKFNKDWLVTWLQNPTPLRPGGAMIANAVKPGAAGAADEIDAAKLAAHPKLSAADAASATEALLALGAGEGLVTPGAFKNEPVNASMAALLFNKLRGCASCHSGKPGSGGSSGPELYSAGTRLKPDYVVEYIRNPQKFDSQVWMPKLDLNEADLQKLTGYLMTLKQGAPQ